MGKGAIPLLNSGDSKVNKMLHSGDLNVTEIYHSGDLKVIFFFDLNIFYYAK